MHRTHSISVFTYLQVLILACITIFRKIHKVRINSDGTGSLVDWMNDIPEFGRLDSIDIYPGQKPPGKP